MIRSNSVAAHGRLALRFVAAYHKSLADYRFFYDDITELGNPATADHAFYYVPGMCGSPGQMRFALPSLVRTYGSRLYMKGLGARAFSATQPVWDKYTISNTDRKLEELRDDLVAMLRRFDRFVVVCSSNGMYDFLAAAATFAPGELESRIQLSWVSCAPDAYSPTVWERVFFPLNGIVARGHNWFAYPNHDLLRAFNPETTTFTFWREGNQQRLFDKLDLESRFQCLGFDWDYVSSSQLGEVAQHVIALISRPWEASAETLIAATDGYWQGASPEKVLATIRRYIPRARGAVRAGSHVGVVTPTNLTELFGKMRSMGSSKNAPSRYSLNLGETGDFHDICDPTTSSTAAI